MKPKKLIRTHVAKYLKEEEKEIIVDKDELNQLYLLKIKEEVEEIKSSNFQDVLEFVDLIQVAISFAEVNGFHRNEIMNELIFKEQLKGEFSNIALNNLNPNNLSNKLYFEKKL